MTPAENHPAINCKSSKTRLIGRLKVSHQCDHSGKYSGYTHPRGHIIVKEDGGM